MNTKIKNMISTRSMILCLFIIVMISCTSSLHYEFVSYKEIIHQKNTLERIDFFLETSVSMKGYVNSNTPGSYPLKEVLPFLITDLDKMYEGMTQIYTVSNGPRKYTNTKQRFYDQLRRGTIFGGRSSKLQNVFGNAVDAITENSVSILVSDCIPDLGREDMLISSSKVTTEIYRKLIQKENFGVAVFQYLSDFNGTYYYDRNNTGSTRQNTRPYYNTLLKNRPFYIWVLGNKFLVKELVSKDIFGVYKQSHFYNIPVHTSYQLLNTPKKGKIAISTEHSTLRIKEATEKRPVQFTIGINLHDQPKGFYKQFMNPSNYSITPKFLNETYTIEAKDHSILSKKNVDKETIEQEKLSHFLQPKFYDLDSKTENITITLYNKTPSWIQQTNLKDDLEISADSLAYKTFAFDAITKAFDKAFKTENDTLAHFTLIKKQQ